MDKLSYLSLALEHRNYMRFEWMIHMLTVVLSPPKKTDLKYHAKVIDGLCHYWDGEQYVAITDAVVNEPLFKPNERVTLTASALENISDSTETTFGRALLNAVCLSHAFGKVFPFIDAKITPRGLESMVNEHLIDDPAEGKPIPDGKVTASQLVLCQRGIEVIAKLSNIISYASSKKSLIPPDGIEAYKEKLLAKFAKEGKDINEPSVFFQLQEELNAYDAEFLKDDPMFKLGISKKTKKSRGKVYSTFGREAGFNDGSKVITIVPSLNEGIVRTPEDYAITCNSARSGSLSRGKGTADGGVSADILARSLYDIIIDPLACKTTRYRTVKMTDSNQFVGRYTDKNVVITKELAKSMAGKTVDLRSPLYCIKEGFCAACMGDRMSKGGKMPSMFGTLLSSGIMAGKLAAFHGTTLTQVMTDLDEVVS